MKILFALVLLCCISAFGQTVNVTGSVNVGTLNTSFPPGGGGSAAVGIASFGTNLYSNSDYYTNIVSVSGDNRYLLVVFADADGSIAERSSATMFFMAIR